MNRSVLITIIRFCLVIALTVSLPSNAQVLFPKSLLTMDQWPGRGFGVLHQIDESSFITVANIEGKFGIHRIDMDSGKREFLIATIPLKGAEAGEFIYSDLPKFVTGNGQTLVDVQGALYITDGTKQGSNFVRDFESSPCCGSLGGERSHIHSLQYAGSRFYFTLKFVGIGNTNAEELWTTDGSSVGTIRISDDFDQFGEVFSGNDGNTYFFAVSREEGASISIWRYSRGANSVRRIATLPQDVLNLSHQVRSVRSRKGVFFCSAGSLWRLSNSATLARISSNCEVSRFSEGGLVLRGDFIYFSNETKLWRSSGHPGDLLKIADAANLGGGEITGLCSTSTKLYFTVGESLGFGSRLYEIGDAGSPTIISTPQKIDIDRCLPEFMVVSFGARSFDRESGIFNSNTDKLMRISGSKTKVPNISAGTNFSLSPPRVPSYQGSVYYIARGRELGKAAIYKTVPAEPTLVAAILGLLN